MTPINENNRRRWRAILISQRLNWLVRGVPDRAAGWIARRFVGVIARWLFLQPNGKPHRAGEIVLCELRRLARMDKPGIFHSDPHVLAYREGKREIVSQFFALLNLDESAVQQMMELDDGLG